MTDQPLVCVLEAIPAEARDRHRQLYEAMFPQSRVSELENGYRFAFPVDRLVDVAEYIKYERLCCPFLTISIGLLPNADTVTLDLTGNAEVKQVLAGMFEENADGITWQWTLA